MIATVYAPDGKQLTDGRGRPLEYRADTELRALVSAQKAWWLRGAVARHAMKRREKAVVPAPIGAQIYLDGEPWMRMEEVPHYAADGVTLLDVKQDWIDVRKRAQDEARQARIAAFVAKGGNRQATAPTETVSAFRDTVADPIALPAEEHTKAVVDVEVPEGEVKGAVKVHDGPPLVDAVDLDVEGAKPKKAAAKKTAAKKEG